MEVKFFQYRGIQFITVQLKKLIVMMSKRAAPSKD